MLDEVQPQAAGLLWRHSPALPTFTDHLLELVRKIHLENGNEMSCVLWQLKQQHFLGGCILPISRNTLGCTAFVCTRLPRHITLPYPRALRGIECLGSQKQYSGMLLRNSSIQECKILHIV